VVQALQHQAVKERKSHAAANMVVSSGGKANANMVRLYSVLVVQALQNQTVKERKSHAAANMAVSSGGKANANMERRCSV
jgi:hypothetical protein